MSTLKLKVLYLILKLFVCVHRKANVLTIIPRAMKDKIASNLHHPEQLEQLYREDKPGFRRAFDALYPEIQNSAAARFWQARLHYETEEISWGSGRELAFVVVASLLAGLVAKLPEWLPVSEDFFYPRNLGFVVFPPLTAYFAWKHRLSIWKTAIAGIVTLATVVYINLLPNQDKSDTLLLACIHLPLFLWTVLGFAYTGGGSNAPGKRLDFLRYNGDLAVMAAVIAIAGGLLTGMTIGLFNVIGLNIEKFYANYIGIFGLAAIPVVGTYLVRTNPQLVNRVSPVIARVFGPLVLVMLLAYLAAILYAGKSPYNDREFLLIFNALLIGVMAIILFSVAENAKTTGNRVSTLLLLLLSVVTVLVNGIALSAILFRISTWGITPNRVAVLGGNLLILINLLLVTVKLFQAAMRRADIAEVGEPIALFLPVYGLWTMAVVFLFPLLFGFK